MPPQLCLRLLLQQQPGGAYAHMNFQGGHLRARTSLFAPMARAVGQSTRRWGGMAELVSVRYFSSFNKNIAPSKTDPPASEKPLYLNRFDHADDPALFRLEDQLMQEKGMLQEQRHQASDVVDAVVPSNHPHQRSGFLKRMRYWHYHLTAEPTIPRTPDLSKGGKFAFTLVRFGNLLLGSP